MKNRTANDVAPTIGAVFTPVEWAEFAVQKFDLFDRWLSGKTIFDPTMGEGNLLEALITTGLKKGLHPRNLPLRHLFGVETNAMYLARFFQKMKATYGVELPKENFQHADIFFLDKENQFDIVFGNPPWQTFADLPDLYKTRLKPKFFEHDLVGNAKDLLLGGSRIDLAALVIQKVVGKNIKPGGEAVFFAPLSLLLNDGAHKHFRTYSVNGTPFRIETVYDFNDAPVFEGVATRHGLVKIVRDSQHVFPVSYNRWEQGTWTAYSGKPAFLPSDPWSISLPQEADALAGFEPILLPKASMPRQGLNTCGANDVYFFDHCEPLDKTHYLAISNKKPTESIVLPRHYLYPLLTSKNFRETHPGEHKWVLLPYRPDGHPLGPAQVAADKYLGNYLTKHRDLLERRKGTLLATLLKKGYWYALLGVGSYNFCPWKIVWEAYGKTSFEPRIFEGHWQVNQSLQAYIPVKSRSEADMILGKLQDKRIEKYLRSLKMEGTMNWAQPGKIKKLIQYKEVASALF